MKPDFGATAGDYAQHREGFPGSLFDRLATFGVGALGDCVVDLGTGTGTMARGFARLGCTVTGVDIAKPLLDEAQRIDRTEGLHIKYREAPAESTGLDAAAFDVVAAGQCWHWFDRERAIHEVVRVLRPGGRLVIAYFDWLPKRGNVVEATEHLIEKHNPSWTMGGGLGVHPWWLREIGDTGFTDVTTFSYDMDVAYTPERWRGRIRASAGVGATLNADGVDRFDDELASLLASDFPDESLAIPHRVFAIVATH